jgi:uncharacterized membrane protein YeaQ/YmgE (transglycosylase-associated protein family)
MSIVGLFILLAIAVLLKFVGNKLAPVVMPHGRLRTVGLGWVGGLFGSWLDSVLWQFGPEVGGINLVAAAVGCAVFIIFLGLFPFIKILLGKI